MGAGQAFQPGADGELLEKRVGVGKVMRPQGYGTVHPHHPLGRDSGGEDEAERAGDDGPGDTLRPPDRPGRHAEDGEHTGQEEERVGEVAQLVLPTMALAEDDGDDSAQRDLAGWKVLECRPGHRIDNGVRACRCHGMTRTASVGLDPVRNMPDHCRNVDRVVREGCEFRQPVHAREQCYAPAIGHAAGQSLVGGDDPRREIRGDEVRVDELLWRSPKPESAKS